MRVVLTGATGFVGHALALRLVHDGHDVVALVRAPARAGSLADAGVQIVQGDVTDVASLRSALPGAEALYHVAGWYKLGSSTPGDGWAINVDGTRNVLGAARDVGVPRIVYTSTCAVNSDTNGELRDETFDFTGRHLSVYDETKAAAHEIAREFAAAGQPVVTVMPGLVYGPGDTSQSGALLAAVIRGGRPAVPGGLVVCAAYIDDVVDGHVKAMELGRVGESYMLAGPVVRFADMLREAAALAGTDGPRVVPGAMVSASASVAGLLERLPLPAVHRAESLRASSASYLGSPAKAERELGWHARSVTQGLRDMLGLAAS